MAKRKKTKEPGPLHGIPAAAFEGDYPDIPYEEVRASYSDESNRRLADFIDKMKARIAGKN